MLRTFSKGGIHPNDNKLTASKPIEILPLPGKVFIPVSQHLGAPANVLVKMKDHVKVGQIIAQSTGFVSANVHSSVSGTVSKIDDLVDNSGYKRKTVIIDVEGDEWDESINRSPELQTYISLNADQIRTRIAQCGIVGMGGATFPAHVKLSVPVGKKAEILLINGAECEPYLTDDHRLMLEKGEEIIVGTQILMRALDVKEAQIGIENNKPDALAYMQECVDKLKANIKIVALQVKYPQGGEKQLIQAMTKRRVPSGGLPVDVGVVVHNVGTAWAVYHAVQKNKPLIERVVTVTGKNLARPSNFLVRIGTPISQLITAAGGLPDDTGKIIGGGPMMGKSLINTEIPVNKGMSGILILPQSESKREQSRACIRCSQCVGVCPMGLEPYLLMHLSQNNAWERSEAENVMDCIECGSCSYTCPSNRPLLDHIRLGKTTVGKIIRNRKAA